MNKYDDNTTSELLCLCNCVTTQIISKYWLTHIVFNLFGEELKIGCVNIQLLSIINFSNKYQFN